MGGDFTDLIAWQQAADLVEDVDDVAGKLRRPGAERVADQMRRASESIPANIAEGYGRGYGREFARFLRIALASAVEVENHLIIAVRGRRLREQEAAVAIARVRRVRALVNGLYKKALGTSADRLASPSHAVNPPST